MRAFVFVFQWTRLSSGQSPHVRRRCAILKLQHLRKLHVSHSPTLHFPHRQEILFSNYRSPQIPAAPCCWLVVVHVACYLLIFLVPPGSSSCRLHCKHRHVVQTFQPYSHTHTHTHTHRHSISLVSSVCFYLQPKQKLLTVSSQGFYLTTFRLYKCALSWASSSVCFHLLYISMCTAWWQHCVCVEQTQSRPQAYM